MPQLFRNNAFSTLGASLTNVATTLTVASGQGDRFPTVTAPDFMMLTLQDASNNIEVVRVTARTSGADSMTITRAQEGTTARAWNIGDICELRLTAAALNPLGLLEGASTAAAIRTTLDVPSRSGANASGTWAISITGNAATASACSGNSATATALQTARTINGASFNGTANITTASWGTARTLTMGATGKSVDGSGNVNWTLAEMGAVGNTGNETIGGAKSFSGSMAVGGSAAPAVSLDVQTTGANALTTAWTTGLTDLNFRLGAMNGVSGGAGTNQGKLGLFYLGTGEVATVEFRRGSGASDGSMAFRTAGVDQAILDASGNLGLGVVPSAWSANMKVLQFGVGSALSGRTPGHGTYLSDNVRFSGDPVNNAANGNYIYSSLAAAYQVAAGVHSWFTAPSGTAGNAISFTQAMTLDASGNLTVNAGSLGYGVGAGGTVTQATSRATGVTINKPTGAITLFAAAGTTAVTSFTVTNSAVAATDTVVLSVRSGTNKYRVYVTAVAAGSFEITFNSTGGTASDAPVINFAVLKAVTT